MKDYLLRLGSGVSNQFVSELHCRSAFIRRRRKLVKILKTLGPLCLFLLVAFVFVAPIGPLPGILIGGTPSEVPDSWGESSAIHEITLEVPGPLPRVVIIWFVQSEGDLYIVGSRGSGWVSMLGEGGPVRMRMEDNTYSLNATWLETGWELAMEAYVVKYRPDYPEIVDGFPSQKDAAESMSVFRLSGQ